MNDAPPGLDSFMKLPGMPDRGMKVPGVDSTRLPGIYEPGPHNGSTPLNPDMMANMAAPAEQNDSEKAMIEALMKSIQNEKGPPATASSGGKKETKLHTPDPKAIEQATTATEAPPQQKINQQNGFLMPLINGLNGVLNRITEALRPIGNFFLKQPTTGTGTA